MRKQKFETSVTPNSRLPTGGPGKLSTSQTNSIQRPGRLSRDVQSKIGETLQEVFDDIVKEGVPDRFARLLEQIEAEDQVGQAQGLTEQMAKSGEPDVTGSKLEVPLTDKPARNTSESD